MNDDDQLELRLADMRQDHADLDDAIVALSAIPMPDMMLIRRLKRKKLYLKDEIVRVENLLTPDILA